MAIGESAGTVYVTIDGDASPLLAKYAQAESASRAAGQAVASGFASGAASGTSAVEDFGRRGGHAFEMISQSSKHAVTDIQAVSGTLRTLDGNQGIRAAERFLTMIPGLAPALQAIFPVVGAIAFAEVIARAAEHFQKLGESNTPQKIEAAFRDINTEIRASNDSLQVANDRLENEIAKIEKKPENGIKLALDEAIQAADELGKHLDTALSKLGKTVEENKVGILGQIFGRASTSDIEAQLKGFQDKVAKVTAENAIPRQESLGGVSILSPELLEKQKIAEQTRINTELAKLYSDEIVNLNHQLITAQQAPTGGTVDATQKIEILRQAISNLQEQQKSIGLLSTGANLKDQKGKAEAEATAARAAQEADNAAARERQKNYETQLRVMAEISHAHQEASRGFVEGEKQNAEALKETTRALGEELKAIVEGDKQQAEMEKQSAELHKRYVDEQLLEQKKLYEPRPDIAQIPIEVPLEQRLRGTAIGANISLRSQGVETQSARQAQIGQMQQLLSLERQMNVPIQQQLALKQRILQSQIASKSQQAGQLFGEITAAGKQLPGAIGGSLAKGIVDGKNIGRDIRESLKGIGQEMLGSVFKELISSVLLNTAATGTLSLSTIGNTLATEANTIWLAVKSIFGFAAGTDSAPGGMALVGEKGPEIVNLPRGSQVIPNHKIGAYANGTPGGTAVSGGGNITIHSLSVHAHGITDPSRFTDHVFRTIPKVAKNRTATQSPYSR